MRNCTILAFLVIFSCTGCVTNRYIYTGSPANNPVLKAKGESEVTAGYSINPSFGYAGGVDLQAAYAVAEHWAITAGYYNRSKKDEWDYTEVAYRRNLFDFGGG